MLSRCVGKMPCGDNIVEIAKILVEVGADVNSKELLSFASQIGNEKMCFFLVENGVLGKESDIVKWLERDPSVYERLKEALETNNILLK